jgi:PAS domain S-box-containing protein
MLLTTALALCAAAQGLESYHQSFAHAPTLISQLSDALFLLWVTPAIMMLLPLPEADWVSFDWPQVLDFAQIGVVALTAYLYFFNVPSAWQAAGPQMALKIIRLQMFRDVALAAGFLVGGKTASGRSIRALFGKMAIVFFLASASDLVFFSNRNASPVTGRWTDLVRSAPFLYVAVICCMRPDEEEPTSRKVKSQLQVPVISQIPTILAPFLVLFMGRRIAAEQIGMVWVAVATSFVLSVARLLLANEKQRRIVEALSRTEQALQRSERMFHAAFRSSPDAVGINSLPEGEFLEVNDGFTRLTGYTRAEALGRTPVELNQWVDPSHRNTVMSKLREGGEVREEEFLCRTKNRDTRICQLTGTPIQLDGQPCALVIVRDITVQKKAEEALRTSEERFRNLVSDLDIGVVQLGPEGETRFINRAALETFGLTEEDTLGKKSSREEILGKEGSKFKRVAIGEDGMEIPLSMRPGLRAIATKRPVRNEVVGWRRTDSNEVLWTLVDAVPHLTLERNIASVILSISNITERKQAEEALRASEERFRTLVQTMGVGIGLLGPDSRIQYANPAAEKMFFEIPLEQSRGKTTGDLDFRTFREDGTEVPYSMRPSQRVIRTGQPVKDEVIGWRRAGSDKVLWTLASVLPLWNKGGTIAGTLSTFTDITDRKQAEEALRASEERLRTLVQTMDVGVAWTGSSGEIQFANQAATKMFGISLEEARGKTTAELELITIGEDGTEIPFTMRPGQRVIRTGQATKEEVIGWRRRGSEKVLWTFVSARPLWNNDGIITGVLATFTDITERQRAEDALHLLSTQLLKLQDDERRRLGRRLHGSLAQSVLAINLNLAQATKSANGISEKARRALGEARSLLQEMSLEIRTMSYLLHPPLLDELGLVSAIKEYVDGFVQRSGIKLELDLPRSFGRLPQQAETALFRVVQESLSNIQRHSGSEAAKISMRGDANGIRLEVSDQGHGMGQGPIDLRSTSRVRLGVGILGMRERVIQLGGKLEIESTPSGTTVRATIPREAEGTDAGSHSHRR